MPVEFLSNEQAARYGRYYAEPSPEQLNRFFHLSTSDLQWLPGRRRPHNKLGCAVQLCTLRFLGTFLTNPLRMPAAVVQTLAEQLHLPAVSAHPLALRPGDDEHCPAQRAA